VFFRIACYFTFFILYILIFGDIVQSEEDDEEEENEDADASDDEVSRNMCTIE
jgi:hypothetical protein